MPELPPADPAAEAESTSGEPNPGLPAPSLTVEFHLDTADTDPPTAGWIEPQLSRALELAGVTAGRLDVTLIDDPAMCDLHEQYCGDPSPTDVITFDLRDDVVAEDEPVTDIEGDLVVCRDEAIRQAAVRGHDARMELLLYSVHGLLHLLGEDDLDDASYEKMHRREDELLVAMGLGPLFQSRGMPATTLPEAES